MTKSMPSRKQISDLLRANAKPIADWFKKTQDGMRIPEESLKLLNTGLDHIPGILPSERGYFERARDLIVALDELAGISDYFERFLASAELAAVRLIPVDSTNSGSPPSKRIGPKGKQTKDKKGDKKPGGQNGHPGSTLSQFEKPDVVIRLAVDTSQLPPGDWKVTHVIKRQVVSVEMKRIVIEYVAEVVSDGRGQKFSAKMPEDVDGHDDGQTSGMIPVEEFKPAAQPANRAKTVTVMPEPMSSRDEVRTGAGAGTDVGAEADAEIDVGAEVADAKAVAVADSGADDGPSQKSCREIRPIGDVIPTPSKRDDSSGLILVPPVMLSPNNHMASFPAGVNAPIQYDSSVAALAVYLNTCQLIPFERLKELLGDTFGLNISPGTLCRYRTEAAWRLEDWFFDDWARERLVNAPVLNVDETGINVNGEGRWFHVACCEDAILGMVHKNRGNVAMDAMGVLEHAAGVIVHDHFHPYFRYDQTEHALCNAHLLRELKALNDKYNLKWPLAMKDFMLSLNETVNGAGGVLDDALQRECRLHFRALLEKAGEECPPEPPPPEWKRGRHAKSPGRNLLERMTKDEDLILRFMTSALVPFTNNAAEQAIRMLKVQLKISGCFKSEASAADFTLIYSYIRTCRLHGIRPHHALRTLLQNQRPEFMNRNRMAA